MDKIYIENLQIFAYHGVFDEEKRDGQEFFVNAVIETDAEYAGELDDLSLAIDYGKVCEVISRVMTEEKYNLIEAAARETIYEILCTFPAAVSAEIEIRKPDAPIDMDFGCVSVKLKRQWHKAVIGLGSNLGDSRKIIDEAVEKFRNNRLFRRILVSDLIVTKPYGYTDQPDFLNGVLICETLYSPHRLLDFMQSVENDAGRTREIHWGPRTLDLDVIFYDDEIISDKRLIVPHPDMQNRRFVLEPLANIAPWYRHPVLEKTASQLLSELVEEPETSPIISIIAVVAKNGVIGSNGTLPWDIPEDRLHFKWLTSGNAVIMGRKTFEDIGHALPGRVNIVISQSRSSFPGASAAKSLKEAIDTARQLCPGREIFLCGGERIFNEGLAFADKVYLTELYDSYPGDVYFHMTSLRSFKLKKSVRCGKARLTFCLYERSTP